MEEKTKQETASWASWMRKKYRLGTLTSQERRKLDEIRFNFEVEDTAVSNKILLLEMARRGKKRPNWKTKLGAALVRGLYKDCTFSKEIRRLAHDWFSINSKDNKALLLDIARRGEKRPVKRTKIGYSLCRYTQKLNVSYDPDFDKQIRELVPYWFVKKSKENKDLLLDMARKGEEKPGRKTDLGNPLRQYTLNGGSCYDAGFDNQIRELAPKWFEKSSDINKTKLLEMARRGEKRPNFKEKLGIVLDNYTRNGRGSYDPLFDKQIRQVAPHWFK